MSSTGRLTACAFIDELEILPKAISGKTDASPAAISKTLVSTIRLPVSVKGAAPLLKLMFPKTVPAGKSLLAVVCPLPQYRKSPGKGATTPQLVGLDQF